MTDYSDIIDLPHHQSQTRPHMSLHDRAAQFAPFAALTGYDAEIAEAARLTDEDTELSDYNADILNGKFNELLEHVSEHPTVTILYFEQDRKKSGGAYKVHTGEVKKIDLYERVIKFTDDTLIEMDAVKELKF